MRIFVTGGTGLVGMAVVTALLAKGNEVTTLARSEASEAIQRALGATPLPGSLTDPTSWVEKALEHDAIIHAAATFESDMGDVDHNLVSQLLEKAKDLPQERKIPFIYTGGCWLYPESPVIPLTERHVLDPLPEFEWMLDSIEQLHACPNILLTVVHPAQVVSPSRGLIAGYAQDLKANGHITIIGDAETQIPFVQAGDLAELYCRALEHQGDGLLLNATAMKSATARETATLVAQTLNLPLEISVQSVRDAQEERGNWVAGYARSQRMEADRARDLLGWEPEYTTIEELVANSLQDMM